VNPIERLDVALSNGRRPPIVAEGVEGPVAVDRISTPCPGCGETTAEGEAITKIHRTWWHYGCAREWMAGAGEAEAWKALAAQIAERPSRFKTTEIRVVIQRLLRMLTDQEGQ
jgi:hypothetical protein